MLLGTSKETSVLLHSRQVSKPSEEEFSQNERAAREEQAGQRGRQFIRSLSRWLSLGLLCLKKRGLGI